MGRVLMCSLLVAALVAACSSGDDDDKAGPAQAKAETLRILVTNDDGVGGEGIAAVVAGLKGLKDVEVTVVAPATNQSGTGGKTSPTPPAAGPAKLVNGADATAVKGFPADSVIYGLDKVVKEKPHLVVSGINAGQNLGPIVEVSGTVGAAREAARRGIPALAVSQGIGQKFDYATGVRLALAWVTGHRKALLSGDVGTDQVANLNVPSCTTGKVRGEVEVPTATEAAGRNPVAGQPDCTSTATDPKDDIAAYLDGYAPLAEVSVPAA